MNKTNLLSKFRFSSAAIALAVLLLIAGFGFELEIWEAVVEFIAMGEHLELDELILPAIFIFLGFSVDMIRSGLNSQAELGRLGLYNNMNAEIIEEISTQLTKLLEFRTALIKDGVNSHQIRHELDRMIITSYNHYERAQRRGNIDSSLMPLVISDYQKESQKNI